MIQMMKELSRRVSSVLNEEKATHYYRPSSLVPVSTKSSPNIKMLCTYPTELVINYWILIVFMTC